MSQPPAARAARTAKKRQPSGTSAYWDSLSGWKPVDVGDELLLGSEEAGFAGLEVLEDVTVLDAGVLHALDAAAGQPPSALDARPTKAAARAAKRAAAAVAAVAAQPHARTKRTRGDRDGDAAAAAAAGEADVRDDVGALRARLRALEAENAALKSSKRRKPSPSALKASAAAAAKAAAPPPAAKPQDASRGAPAAAAAAAAAADVAAAAPEGVDTSAWAPFSLHPLLERALGARGFGAPTPIQAAVLPPAVRDRRDVIGAAETGSGKTLAFGLPILQLLLSEREAAPAAAAMQAAGAGGRAEAGGSPLRALVLAPTRELALQVSSHLQALGKVVRVLVAPIVGGLAPVKQARMLALRPAVVVATPGRLWALMRDGHSHLTDLTSLSFLVLDEADRMVQQGHFSELEHILNLVPYPARQQAAAEEAAAAAADSAAGGGAPRPRRGLAPERKARRGGKAPAPPRRSEERQQQRDEAECKEERQEEEGQAEGAEEQPLSTVGDGNGVLGGGEGGGEGAGGASARRQLIQTFVFSATLTLPRSLRKRLRKGGGGSSGAATLEALMDRIAFRGHPAVVDLTTERRLAARVEEAAVECLEGERDAVLYYLLARHPGRTLVFVNAVSSTRRVAALLKLLGLPARALHAQQQQRQRLKALDRFKEHPQGVLVATDVAARGLDIPHVATVLHYQMPASADVYIHRCGRTARTGGGDGVSIALVTPKEAPRFVALCRALERPPPSAFPVDPAVLREAQRRVALAITADELERRERKAKAHSTWEEATAAEADLDADAAREAAAAAPPRGRRRRGGSDDEGGGGAGEGGDGTLTKREAARLAQVKRSLAELLAAPLQPSVSARFFAGGGAGAAAVAAAGASGRSQAGRRRAAGGRVSASEEEDEEEAGGAGASEAATAAVVAETVSLASRLNSAALAAREQAGRKRGGGAAGAQALGSGGASKKKRRTKGLTSADIERLLVSRNQRRRERRAGLVVVGGGAAFGRDISAPSALQTLRSSRL